MNEPAQTPDKNLLESALKHYDEAASAIHHHSSVIPQAIKFYFKHKNRIELPHEDKIKHMRIAASVCHFGFTDEQMDLLVSLYDLVSEKGGNTELDDIVDVEFEVKNRADAKKVVESLEAVKRKEQ